MAHNDKTDKLSHQPVWDIDIKCVGYRERRGRKRKEK